METHRALSVLWNALHKVREDCISEGIPENDYQWDNITYAMAKLHEALEIDHSEI